MSTDGDSVRERRVRHHINIINNTFEDSPSYQEVSINNSDVRIGVWIVSDGDDTRKLIMKPGGSISAGDIIEDSQSNKWLCVLSVKDNPVGESGDIEKCNSEIGIETETKIQIGTDDLGRPIYEKETTTTYYPCVVKTRTRLSHRTDGAINLPDGRVFILMQYDPNLKLDIQSNFKLHNDQVWSIVELDMTGVENGSGVLGMMAEREESNT